MVQLSQISKRYGDSVAVHPVDLEIARNQVTALIGPSGSGKSTLLRIILGLIEPSTGAVTIDGEPMSADSAMQLRRDIGYVVQDGGLFPHLTAEQNVALMSNYLRRTPSEVSKRIDELCDLTHMPRELMLRFPNELSGGQRQRIGLMRALALKPKLLLLDEPLGALDPLIRAALQADLKEIFARLGQTVVFVTHDMGEAAFLADRIVLLKDGRLVQGGSLEEFHSNPSEPFVTEFLTAQRQVGALR
jgi:osmoprotectant transport system ATP-binding protein